MRALIALLLMASLAGCGFRDIGFLNIGGGRAEPEPVFVEPVAEPDGAEVATGGEPVQTAVLDAPTTTTAPVVSADGRLGTTVGSLGDPAEAGFWVKTPLVSAPASGRAVYEKSGRSVQVELIPSGGAPGSGSEVSLSAMQLLDAPLTGLPELVIYLN